MPLLQRKGNPNVVKTFSPEEAQGALSSGEWEGRGGEAVSVPSVDRITGEERNLPLDVAAGNQSEFATQSAAAPVHDAMAEARQREFGTGAQQGLTVLEGAGSALTLGGTDWLARALGANTGDRAEVNPGYRAAGEIAGAIAAAVATGGLGAAGELGAAGSLLARTTPLGAITARTAKLGHSVGGIRGLMAAETLESLAQGAGGINAKLAIKDEELTAKAALLELGYAGAIGLVSGGIAGGLSAGAKAAKGYEAVKGIPLDTVEGKDFHAFTKNVIGDLQKADDDVISNVAVRRKADAAGQPFVRNLKDDYLARATKDVNDLGGAVEKRAADILSQPPKFSHLPQTDPTRLLGAGSAVAEQSTLGSTRVQRISDVSDEFLGQEYTARNVKQYIDEVAEESLAFPKAKGTPEYDRVVKSRQRLHGLIAPKGEGVGTSATKGRSKLYGPENNYKITANIPEVKKELQEYYDATLALGQKQGVTDVEDRLLGGATAHQGRGFTKAFNEPHAEYKRQLERFQTAEDAWHADLEKYDEALDAWESAPKRKRGPKPVEPARPADLVEPRPPKGVFREEGDFAPTQNLRTLLADAEGSATEAQVAGGRAGNAARKAEFRAQAAARPGMEAEASAQTAARRETTLASQKQFEEEAARYERIAAVNDEVMRTKKLFQDLGGYGDSVTLGAEPGSAFLRKAAGDDYVEALEQLARETGQEIPEDFLQTVKKLGDDLDAVAAQGGKGPLAAKDLVELRQARVAFKRHKFDLNSFVNKSETEAFQFLSDMSRYTKALENAGGKLAIPKMISALEENAAQMTRRLESLTGLSAPEIDRAYNQLMRQLGGPPAQFDGPASDLHKLWLVNQAMKDTKGEIGKAIRASIEETEKGLEKGGFPRTGRILKSGIRRGAAYTAFKAASAVAGPFVGSTIAGAASQAVISGLNATGFLAGATGKVLHAIGTAAGAASKAVRLAPTTVHSITRETSFSDKPAPKKETPRQTFERLGKEVTDLAVDPQTPMKANQALAGIRDVSWGVGDKMEVMLLDGIKYLAEKFPKDTGVLQRWGMSTWKPTDAQVTDWLNRVAAVAKPLNSIMRFMSGGGSPAEAETIRQVHPEIYREFQTAFMENLPTVKDKIPGSTRVRLGILFNAPIDSRLRPEFRQFMREDWVARAEAQKPIDTNSGMTPTEPSPAQKLLG